MKQYKFKLFPNDSTDLYKLICNLEDNNIKYYSPKNKNEEFIIINPKDFIKQYNNINYLLDKINLIYKDNSCILKNMPKIDNNYFISFNDDYYINPFTGEWYSNNDSKIYTLSDLLIIYKKPIRKNYIKLLNSFREVLNYELLDYSNISEKDWNIFGKFLQEIKYSIIKLKFIGKNSEKLFNDFLKKESCPRCIPWIENNNYGMWIWPERYFIDNLKSYPNTEIIQTDSNQNLSDVNYYKLGEGFLINLKNNTNHICYFTHKKNQFLLDLDGYNSFKDSTLLLVKLIAKLKNEILLDYDQYDRSNNNRKKDIESLINMITDLGFLPLDKNKRKFFTETWKQLINLPD